MKRQFEPEDIEFLAIALLKLFKLQKDSKDQDDDPYMDVQGLAGYLGIDESLIKRQIKRGMPHEKNGNYIRFRKVLLVEWLKKELHYVGVRFPEKKEVR